MDPSEGRLSKAKARSSAVRWIVGPAEKLPLPDDSVDAVPSTTAFSSSISPPPSRNSAGCSHQAESLPSGESPSRCPPEPIQRIVRRWFPPRSAAPRRRRLLDGRHPIQVAVRAGICAPPLPLAAIRSFRPVPSGSHALRERGGVVASHHGLDRRRIPAGLATGSRNPVGHQPLGDRLKGSAFPPFDDDPASDLQRQGRRCA